MAHHPTVDSHFAEATMIKRFLSRVFPGVQLPTAEQLLRAQQQRHLESLARQYDRDSPSQAAELRSLIGRDLAGRG